MKFESYVLNIFLYHFNQRFNYLVKWVIAWLIWIFCQCRKTWVQVYWSTLSSYLRVEKGLWIVLGIVSKRANMIKTYNRLFKKKFLLSFKPKTIWFSLIIKRIYSKKKFLFLSKNFQFINFLVNQIN